MPKTLIILSPGFAADETDSTCLPPIQQFVRSLRDLYPEVHFIILSFQYPFQKKEYSWHGVTVISLGGKNRAKLFRLMLWFQAYRKLKELVRKNQVIGLLSLWLTECALLGKYFARRHQLKHFMWIQGQDVKSENQYIRRIRPKASEVIAISDSSRSEFVANHGIQPFLIAENGVSRTIFPPLNTGKRDVDILGVGSLIPLKNYTFFLEIIAEIRKLLPKVQVKICGTGVDADQLKKMILSLNLTDNVTMCGLLPHAEVLNLMARSKVFLHTSHFEGNSTVLIEALYSGCETFSTRPLTNRYLKHFHLLINKKDFVQGICTALRSNEPTERILFNSMDDTARKIMNLFS